MTLPGVGHRRSFTEPGTGYAATATASQRTPQTGAHTRLLLRPDRLTGLALGLTGSSAGCAGRAVHPWEPTEHVGDGLEGSTGR